MIQSRQAVISVQQHTASVWAVGINMSRKAVAFKRQCADTLGALLGITINLKTSRHRGIKLTLMNLSPETFSFYFYLLSLCLCSVSSPTKTYPVAGLRLSLLLDKQMVSQPDLQLSDKRRACCSKKKKKGHHYTSDSWNSLEEGRHIFK